MTYHYRPKLIVYSRVHPGVAHSLGVDKCIALLLLHPRCEHTVVSTHRVYNPGRHIWTETPTKKILRCFLSPDKQERLSIFHLSPPPIEQFSQRVLQMCLVD